MKKCSHPDGCKRPFYSSMTGSDACRLHHNRLLKNGEWGHVMKHGHKYKHCIAEGCKGKVYGHGYCEKHLTRVRKYGDPYYVKHRHGNGKTRLERIYSRIDKSGYCHERKGSLSKRGYGKVRYKGKHRRVHRLIYTLEVGEIPKGLMIRHKCHNPLCCNPTHLVPGTAKQNTRDMIDAKRNRFGSSHSNSKIDEKKAEDVKRLLQEYTGYGSCTKISLLTGVSINTVYSIKYGTSWKHITI